MFVGIISHLSLITSQIAWITFDLWPLNDKEVAKVTLQLSDSKSLNKVIMNLGDNIYGNNILTKFHIQPDHLKHFWIMAIKV